MKVGIILQQQALCHAGYFGTNRLSETALLITKENSDFRKHKIDLTQIFTTILCQK